MGDCNIKASGVNTWMKTQGLTNKIMNIHKYSNNPITYQQSKDCPIDSINWSASLAANWGGFLSFGRILEDHEALCIEINENMLLWFCQHTIIPPTAWNLCLEYTRKIKRFNVTLRTSFVKHGIYQKIHYIHVWSSYPLPTHLAQTFEKLENWPNALCMQQIKMQK